MWIPVDSMTTEAAVTYIPGSHKWGLFRPRHFVDSSPYAGTEHLDDMPNIDEMIASGEIQAIAYAVEPGDVLAFDARVINGSKGLILSSSENNNEHGQVTSSVDKLKKENNANDCYDKYAEIGAHRRVALRFVGDDVIYCERPGETAIPPHDMVPMHRRKHGDSLTCDLFPKVWPKS